MKQIVGTEELTSHQFGVDVSTRGVFATQVSIGKGIYGTDRRVDFFIRCLAYPEGLAIESKCQASSGSVDQKFPHEVLCIEKCRLPTIIVLVSGRASQH